jgi:hypothetical protein
MKVVMLYEVASDGMEKARVNGVVGKWTLEDWSEVLG